MTESSNLKVSGAILVGAALLGMVALMHHPTAAHSSAATLSERLTDIALLARAVHGAMIAVSVALLIALLRVALWLGGGAALAAAVLSALGVQAMLGAALINGFVVVALAERGETGVGALLWTLNQTLAGAGVIALSLAIIAYGASLWSRARWLAVMSFLVGGTGAGAMLSGAVMLHVAGMQASFALLAAWFVAVGVWLLRGAARR